MDRRSVSKKSAATAKELYGDDFHVRLGSKGKGVKKPNSGFATHPDKAVAVGNRNAERWRANPELHPWRIHKARKEALRQEEERVEATKYRRPLPGDFKK